MVNTDYMIKELALKWPEQFSNVDFQRDIEALIDWCFEQSVDTEEAFQDGHDQGYSEGTALGYEQGYDEGWDNGYKAAQGAA